MENTVSNTILTPTAVTRKALAILHQKLNFVGSINRQYDSQFANAGGKIGSTLNIRMPNQYVIRSGAALSTQDTTEVSVPLAITSQKGVDVKFSSAELTLQLDDFAERILEPAMAVLAANIESDALGMYKDVWNQVNNVGSAITFNKVLQGRKTLNDNLCPMDSNRSVILNTQDNVDLVDALKGLFQDSASISKQYRDGVMGRTAGFEFSENTLLPRHTSGSDASAYLVNGTVTANGTPLSAQTVPVDTGTGTLKKGDVLTFAGVYSVHPETKATTAVLQQFVVAADVSANATSITVLPGMATSGALKNISGVPADNAVITKVGGSSASYGLSLAHHRDAFCFATCDLQMPKGVDFSAREVYDGISMRIVRAYDINTDTFPCRIDVMYGYKSLRPQLACRLANQ